MEQKFQKGITASTLKTNQVTMKIQQAKKLISLKFIAKLEDMSNVTIKAKKKKIEKKVRTQTYQRLGFSFLSREESVSCLHLLLSHSQWLAL